MAISVSKPNTVRQDLGEVITEVFSREWLEEFAEQIKNMHQGVWGQGVCPECNSPRKLIVTIPDLKGQLAAVTSLLEQAEGRPGTASGEVGGVTLVVERSWPEREEDGEATHQDQLPDAPTTAGVSSVKG